MEGRCRHHNVEAAQRIVSAAATDYRLDRLAGNAHCLGNPHGRRPLSPAQLQPLLERQVAVIEQVLGEGVRETRRVRRQNPITPDHASGKALGHEPTPCPGGD